MFAQFVVFLRCFLRHWAGDARDGRKVTASFLNGLNGTLRSTLQTNAYLLGQLATAEQLNSGVRACYQTFVREDLVVYFAAKLVQLVRKDVLSLDLVTAKTVELRQALHEWVLATFEAGALAIAGAGALTLGTTASSFALAGGDTAADALV